MSSKNYIKTFKPKTPSLRFFSSLVYQKSAQKPPKYLIKGKKKTGGRDNSGHISTRHIGGGVKSSYRIVSFKKSKLNIFGVVKSIDYDPNRNASIALIEYSDSSFEYNVAVSEISVGSKIIASRESNDFILSPGSSFPLREIKLGTIVCLIEFTPFAGAKIARSAGAFARLVGKEDSMAILKLRSGETRKVSLECFATIGKVSNEDFKNTILGKAGRRRWNGVRPTTRGIAMNPVDHPNGGRTNGGKHFATPWGKCTKGLKTRKRNKISSKFIISKS